MEIVKGKKTFFRYWRGILVGMTAMACLIGTSYLNLSTQTDDFIKWGSPDETANYVFTKLYAQEGRLSIPEKYNVLLKDIVHPRSFWADQGLLKPMSFLGLPLFYGTIAHFSTYKIIPFLTPLMAAVGIIYFYLLIKLLFDRNTALVSAMMLAVFPVYTYYSSRSMFHNVLFLVFIIISMYCLMLMNREAPKPKDFVSPDRPNLAYPNWLAAGLSGFFLAMAISTRTSELIWLGPGLLILWLFNIKKTGIIKPIILILAMIITLGPVLHWNQALNGAAWRTGYAQVNNSFVNIGQPKTETFTTLGKAKEFIARVTETVFMFGIKPKTSLKLFFEYSNLYIWLFPAALAGFSSRLLRYKSIKKGHIAYALTLAVISAILIIYYGSWDFHDNPDASKITIGNSYTRYWLPIYLGLIPLAALLLVNLTRWIRSYSLVWTVRFAVIALIAIVSLQEVWAGSDEGLKSLIAKNQESREQWQLVLANTERNAVIITRYHDKLMFPERKVILGLFDDDNMIREYAHMTKLLPTYYLNFTLPAKDFKYLNDRRLKSAGLRIKLVKQVNDSFSLYKLSLIK